MLKRLLGTCGAMALASGIPTQAVAEITNTATVTGNYGATSVDSSDDEAVEVIAADPDLRIEKSVAAPDISQNLADRADAGDTITYTFVITNDGNVTMNDVTPVDTGPTFNGQAGSGSLSAFEVVGSSPVANTATLAPGASATFEATYTMSALDVLHAADTKDLTGDDKKLIDNSASSSGTLPDNTAYADPDTSEAETEIAPFPEINLEKAAVLNDEINANGFAETDETITYTYTVTNTGNVPLTGVTVADIHEGTGLTAGTDVGSETLTSEGPLAGTTGAVSGDDATPGNGIWGVIQPGAVVTFTYIHTVTQAEVDDG